MSNLPDDWDNYWRVCERCDQRYHASGTDPCHCEPCECCGEIVPPAAMREDGWCVDCAYERDECEDETTDSPAP